MVSRNRDNLHETVAIFRSEDGRYEPKTLHEVAKRLGCSRGEASDRLETLVSQGMLETKSVSSDAQVWWATRPAPNAGDQTDVGRQTRELEMYETLLEESKDVNTVIQPDGTYSYLTPSAAHVLGHDPAELIGENAFEYIHPDDHDEIWDEFVEVVENPGYSPRVELRFEHADGSWVVLEAHARNLLDDPQINGIVAYARDITRRKERERKLEAAERRYRTLAENFPNGAVSIVDQDLQYITVGGESVAETGVHPETLEGSHVSEHLPPELAEVFVRNYRAALDGETNTIERVVDGTVFRIRFVPVRNDDGDVFAALGMSQDVTEQVEYEQELENQREHLSALNNLHGVVRDINDAIVQQSTREEIEEMVCERLAESDSYLFAWIGDVDARTKSVELRAQAGTDGSFETVDMSIDQDGPDGRSPIGRAARNKEVQVTKDALTDPAHEQWRELAEEYGYRSAAAIPIVHQDTLYGVLGVYTERVGAFAETERNVVAQLGEMVGHAIVAIDRKHALMSDEVVEIELRIENALAEVGFEGSIDGRITFEDTVSVGEETYLQYGTAAGGAFETVVSLTETITHWEDVTVIGEQAGETQFELRLSEPPVISTVAARGGYIDEAVIENDTMHMCIHLPTTANVRHVIGEITDPCATAEMVTRRQVSRTDERERVEHQLTEALTDRQRSALEASFHSGFFEWPRESSGEDVAESLGVSAPTFHQHLRKAQQKVLESLLG